MQSSPITVHASKETELPLEQKSVGNCAGIVNNVGFWIVPSKPKDKELFEVFFPPLIDNCKVHSSLQAFGHTIETILLNWPGGRKTVDSPAHKRSSSICKVGKWKELNPVRKDV